MAKLKEDFIEHYPYRISFIVKVFSPGEYVPNVEREFKNEDGEVLYKHTDEEIEALNLPRGETQLIVGINEIYYDAAQNSENPEWVLLTDEMGETLHQEELREYRKKEAERLQAVAEEMERRTIVEEVDMQEVLNAEQDNEIHHASL